LLEIENPYINAITGAIVRGLQAKSLYGDDENIKRVNKVGPHHDRNVRVSFEKAANDGWHVDLADIPPSRISSFPAERCWHRIISYGVVSHGTAYKIGMRTNIEVPGPPGAVSSHLEYKSMHESSVEWGAKHRGVGDPEGRAILLLETLLAPVIENQTPWRIQTLCTYKPV
jgi:hypothetical protein